MVNSCVNTTSSTNDKSDYNNAAWFYDTLARIIFGKAINKSQTYFLKLINPGSSILIVGGGTGWILNEITQLQSNGLEIVYVEKSLKMIRAASQRLTGLNKVIFIHEAVENSVFNKSFDIVITSFLFDSFSNSTINIVFQKLAVKLKPGGLWLYSDFIKPNKLWHKLLINSMYAFFKVVCKIEAGNLPDMTLLFKKFNFELIDQRSFYGNFITGKVYMSRLNDSKQVDQKRD